MEKNEEIKIEDTVEQSQEAQQASEEVEVNDSKLELAKAPEEELLLGFNKLTPKQRKKRAIIISVTSVVVVIALFALAMWLWFFVVNYPVITLTHKNIDDLKLNYTLSEDGQYVSNINYDAYLTPNSSVSIFSKKINLSEAGVSAENTAQQNTEIIQGIIDNQEGGATIFVDGNYKIKSLQLKDKICLIINENCSLIGPTYSEGNSATALIWAKDAKEITIAGPGTIVANGKTFTFEAKDETILRPLDKFNVKERVLEARKRIRSAKNGTRPHTIMLDNCSDVKVQNIRLFEAANWTVKVIDSNDVTFKDVVIDNNIHVANADGIDIVSSQDVKVIHCFIATADDGVCIKANGNENAYNISVDRCSILSMANNFKIGTETSKAVEKVSVTNCYFFMPDNVTGGYAGVAIESADGSKVNDVYVDNIYMKGVSSPALIWLGYRLDEKNGSDGKTVGSMDKVVISNITAKDVELPSAITGCVRNGKTYYVKNVEIANFNITYRNTGENLNVGKPDFEASMGGIVDANKQGYPEITRVLHRYLFDQDNSDYFDIPVYGLFARHVDGLKVYNLNVTARSCNELQRDNITQAKDRYDVLNVKVN